MGKSLMSHDEVVMKPAGEILRGEMLSGSCPGVSFYKSVLKAKKRFDLTTYSETQKTQILFFTRGKGYVGTENGAHNITEEAVFVPLYDSEKVFIYAVTDLEFIEILVDLSPEDVAAMKKVRMTLPYFCLMSDCFRYEEDFKGPGTISYGIIKKMFLGRVLMGAVIAEGPNVNGEHSHKDLDQWYFGLEGACFKYSAGGETFTVKAGDLTHTGRGIVHRSETGAGQKMRYMWFELITEEKQ